MTENPNTAPSSYYTFIHEQLQTIGDAYFFEDLVIMTENDIT
jgi:hypothetical protein